jgi:hypothetical protein
MRKLLSMWHPRICSSLKYSILPPSGAEANTFWQLKHSRVPGIAVWVFRVTVNQVRGMTFHPRPVVGAAGQAANGPPPATRYLPRKAPGYPRSGRNPRPPALAPVPGPAPPRAHPDPSRPFPAGNAVHHLPRVARVCALTLPPVPLLPLLPWRWRS